MLLRGVARIFKRGGGGHTGSNNIVMAFLPRNTVGCLLKKRLTKGGHRHPRTPLVTPLLLFYISDIQLITSRLLLILIHTCGTETS